MLLLHELLLFSASAVPYACYNGSKNVPFMMCDKSHTQITVEHGSVQVSNPTSSYVTCIVFSFIIFIRIKPFNLTFIYSVPASVLQISRVRRVTDNQIITNSPITIFCSGIFFFVPKQFFVLLKQLKNCFRTKKLFRNKLD